MQKTVYRVRTNRAIEGRLALDLVREQDASGLRPHHDDQGLAHARFSLLKSQKNPALRLSLQKTQQQLHHMTVAPRSARRRSSRPRPTTGRSSELTHEINDSFTRRANAEESAMGAGLRPCGPSEVFETIIKASDNRVPVVPLIGAGLSVEAGVPTTQLMTDYMVKVKLLIDLWHRKDHEDMDYARPLKAGGWPDPDELNDLILVGLQERLHNRNPPEWIGDLTNPESDLVRTLGSLLGAVRPFTLHEYLQRVQPSLLGFIPRSPGHCPVMMTAMTDKLARVLSPSEHATNAGRGEAADSVAPEDRAAERIWDEVLGRVGQAIRNSLDDPSSFEQQRERLGEILKVVLKRLGLRDRILRDLELDWRAMLRLLTLGIPSWSIPSSGACSRATSRRSGTSSWD